MGDNHGIGSIARLGRDGVRRAYILAMCSGGFTEEWLYEHSTIMEGDIELGNENTVGDEKMMTMKR
jgi:hypothetical protein